MKTFSWIVWLVALCMSCSWLSAQEPAAPSPAVVPRLVNFSGKATDAQGKVISGIAGATFAIYKDQYEGSPLWLETQNVQADSKGNYTVQLGATRPEGLPLDLFSSGEARWLGVAINSGQEQPRVLLLSVPYALKAADAETISGLPASAFARAAGPASGNATLVRAAPTQGTVTSVGLVGIELGRVCFRRRTTTLTLSVVRWVLSSAMATFPEAPL